MNPCLLSSLPHHHMAPLMRLVRAVGAGISFQPLGLLLAMAIELATFALLHGMVILPPLARLAATM